MRFPQGLAVELTASSAGRSAKHGIGAIRGFELTAAPRRSRADWSDLNIFWAVAVSGGVSAAARALGLTQPTVTKRVEDLEQRLNTKLLVRRSNGVSLTEAGKKIFDHVVTMQRSAELIEHLVADDDRRDEGHVTIASPDGVATYCLAPELGRFFRANPRIEIALDAGLWPDHPVSGAVDISLQFERPSDPNMISTPLAHFHYCFFASEEYLSVYGRPRSLAEVATHRYVHLSAYGSVKDGYASRTEGFLGLVQRTFETNCSSALVNAVRNGAGVATLPTAILPLFPELVMLDVDPITKPTLWLTHHRDVSRSVRIARVSEWLRGIFDARERPWFRPEFVHPKDFGLAQPAAAKPAQLTAAV
jgi:DNA-binding transcriptional LysR family regulator